MAPSHRGRTLEATRHALDPSRLTQIPREECAVPHGTRIMDWLPENDAFYWDATFGRAAPSTKHSTAQKATSKEDVVFAERQEKGELEWHMVCLCDGHGGAEAAEYIQRHLTNALKIRLPQKQPERERGFSSWALEIRCAIVEAFAEMDEGFEREFGDECPSGSTVTLALSCGWFLTVANVGDSEAVLDSGLDIELMTHSHRLEECEKERQRLQKAGVMLARLAHDLSGPADDGVVGLGPQRCWPGGLANSRSIGDLEGGKHIVSSPYIKQCILPHHGSRLIIGSDGVWDMIDPHTTCVLTRANLNKTAADRVVLLAVYRNDWAVHDDTTAAVIDFLPTQDAEFSRICKLIKKRRKQSSRKKKAVLRRCFCAPAVKEADEDDKAASTRIICFAEVDCVTTEGRGEILTAMDDDDHGASSDSLTERTESTCL